MKPLLICVLITLTVCASHPLETTKSPLAGNNALLNNSSVPLEPADNHPKEIRLDISLNIDDNEKETVDVDLGMCAFVSSILTKIKIHFC